MSVMEGRGVREIMVWRGWLKRSEFQCVVIHSVSGMFMSNVECCVELGKGRMEESGEGKEKKNKRRERKSGCRTNTNPFPTPNKKPQLTFAD